MPFLKFSRDKRGYEHFFLMQPAPRTDTGRASSRLLYWFRTPPNVKIGREPFDGAARRALERQNPGIRFDWETLANTPIPPPTEPEPWRERRRAERAARRAAAEPAVEATAEAVVAGSDAAIPEASVVETSDVDAAEVTPREASGEPPAVDGATPPGTDPNRRRRRRRRRRGRGGGPPAPTGAL